MSEKFFIKNEDETLKFGEILGKNLPDKIVLALCGDLGAGKTTMSKGILSALGYKEEISSPTYNLMNTYEMGDKTVIHFDFYRIEDPLELENIGYYFFSKRGVVIIEWADKFIDELPKNYIRIDLNTDGDGRSAILSLCGEKRRDVFEKINAELKKGF